MRLAEKISASSVALLAAIASLLFLIKHIRTMIVLREAPQAAEVAEQHAPAARAGRRGQISLAPFGSPRAGSLVVPVAGLGTNALSDTWGQARSEGRSHEGIDILAPMGTPVVAGADGRIVKFFDSARGGVTIYQFDSSERFVYYYAHLSWRAPGLREGDIVVQGQTIGFVGATGNASTPHLHFELQRLGPERRWWIADSVNPYPYLLAGEAPQ